MIEEKIKKLLKQREKIDLELTAYFNVYSRRCRFRERRWEGMDDWYACINPKYPLAEYNIVTPCNLYKCPEIRK